MLNTALGVKNDTVFRNHFYDCITLLISTMPKSLQKKNANGQLFFSLTPIPPSFLRYSIVRITRRSR